MFFRPITGYTRNTRRGVRLEKLLVCLGNRGVGRMGPGRRQKCLGGLKEYTWPAAASTGLDENVITVSVLI